MKPSKLFSKKALITSAASVLAAFSFAACAAAQQPTSSSIKPDSGYRKDIYNHVSCTVCADVYFNAAMDLYWGGNYSGAIEGFDKAVSEDRNYADAYFYRGLSYVQMKYIQTGLSDLRIAAQLYNDAGDFVCYQDTLRVIAEVEA